MAYNSYFPASYQPVYYQQNWQQPQQIQQPQTQPQQQQIQNSGLVVVRSRAEAQNYPVAPGNSVTFKDETAPFVYTKTMGFSQLDRPVFETFRLVREEEAAQDRSESTRGDDSKKNIDLSDYALKTDLEELREELSALHADFEKRTASKSKKKEGAGDD